jgi:hypothetical protein
MIVWRDVGDACGGNFANELAFLGSIDELPRIFDHQWPLRFIALAVRLPTGRSSASYACSMISQRFGDDQSLFVAVSMDLDGSLTIYRGNDVKPGLWRSRWWGGRLDSCDE